MQLWIISLATLNLHLPLRSVKRNHDAANEIHHKLDSPPSTLTFNAAAFAHAICIRHGAHPSLRGDFCFAIRVYFLLRKIPQPILHVAEHTTSHTGLIAFSAAALRKAMSDQVRSSGRGVVVMRALLSSPGSSSGLSIALCMQSHFSTNMLHPGVWSVNEYWKQTIHGLWRFSGGFG